MKPTNFWPDPLQNGFTRLGSKVFSYNRTIRVRACSLIEIGSVTSLSTSSLLKPPTFPFGKNRILLRIDLLALFV